MFLSKKEKNEIDRRLGVLDARTDNFIDGLVRVAESVRKIERLFGLDRDLLLAYLNVKIEDVPAGRRLVRVTNKKPYQQMSHRTGKTTGGKG